MVKDSKIAFWILQSISVIAFGCYTIVAIFGTLLLYGFAFNPLVTKLQMVLFAFCASARWIPIVLYFVPFFYRELTLRRRFILAIIGVFCVVASYFMSCLFSTTQHSGVIDEFKSSFWESTLDIWPCAIMFICRQQWKAIDSGNQVRRDASQ